MMSNAVLRQEDVPDRGAAPAGFLSVLWRSDLRLLALLAAVILYGLFGSPTPDRPGATEALIALLLVAACGGWQVLGLFRCPAALKFWQKAGLALLLYGVTIPLLGALIAGNDLRLMIRDVIPFFFLLLPCFLMPLFGRPLNREGAELMRPAVALSVSVVVAGSALAARALLRSFCQGRAKNLVCEMPPLSDPYLANSPLVLAAFLLLLAIAGLCLYQGGRKALLLALLFASSAMIPLAAMTVALQRASLALSVLVIVLLLAGGLWRRPMRMLAPVALLLAGLWLLREPLGAGWTNLLEKNTLVGSNMRWQEAAAVIGALADSLPAVLFGRGWGAEFISPAVGGLRVNFTHSLFTTYFLKTGLCGLVLAGLYLGAIACQLGRLVRGSPVIGLALAAPFVIDLFLYASFKGLGFGILLTLILLWAESCGRLQQRAGCSRNQLFRKQ